MRILEVAGICVVALLVVLFAIFFRRRLLSVGGGTIRLQVRLSTLVPGRGWSTGIGQFVGDELRIHRMFSFAVRPKRVLDRASLAVQEQRRPEGPERLTVPGHWIILRCQNGSGTQGSGSHGSGTQGTDEIEIAMAESTVTGFLSWLEASAPGQRGNMPSRPVIHPRTIEQ